MLRWLFIVMFSINLMATPYCDAYMSYEKGDLIKAKHLLDPLAFKGDTKAQNLLALVNFYSSKMSATQKWFQTAATKGDLKAAYNLGIYYFLNANIKQSEKWMHKAEELNEAKFALGVLFAESNPKKAKAYFYLPAVDGNLFAKAHLCVLPSFSKDPNNEKYQELCQGFQEQASLITGKFYDTAKPYGSINKALYYLKYAVDQGNAEAMNLYGTLLYKRRGQSDEANALLYFLKAADKGNVDAKVNAAWIYYVGQKWTRKPALGYKMLLSAEKDKSAKAKFYMGILHIRGWEFSHQTVKTDVNVGYEFIKTAAKEGDVQAMQYMINNGASKEEREVYNKQLQNHYKAEEKKRALHFLYDGC